MRPRALRTAWCMIVISAWIVSGDTRAQTSYPMTLYVEPVAVSRGQSTEITIIGRENFSGAWKLLCEPPGLRGDVQIVENTQPTTKARGAAAGRRRSTSQVRARLHVAHDAPLGPRELRVATPQGVSSVGLVVVVDGPVVAETPAADTANDRPASAQMLTLPCVVSGRIARAEDVDWYSFELAKGQRVGFEIWGNRIENKIHDLQTHLDPILSLHNRAGRELAAADNNHFADPLLTFQAPESGTYVLQVRDTTYAGNPAWAYALLAATAPIPTSAFPLAVNPGTTALLELHGPGTNPAIKVPLVVPPLLDPGPHLFALSKSPGSLPFPLVVTPLPISSESTDAPSSGDSGKTIKLPAALCGRLAQRGDSDEFTFNAHKNAIYTFEAMARRAGSECDPVLRLLESKGTVLTEVDDSPGMGKDARIEWKAPADGTNTIQITDLHGRGGEAFAYVLLAQRANPDFSVTCDPDMINLGPGGRVPLFVRLTRRAGFAGELRLDLEKLPPGVTASPLQIPPSMTEGVIVIEAAPDAKRESLLVALKATGLAEGAPIIHQASPLEEIYLPGGGRGHFPVHTLALAVTDPSDITLEATPREVVLSPGESVPVDVTVTRNPRFEQGVNLAVVLQHLGGIHGNPLPPGVKLKEAGSKTLLGPKETKGKIIIEAAASAPPSEKVPITVMGHVSINFVVKTAYCSSPILVTVRPKTATGAR